MSRSRGGRNGPAAKHVEPPQGRGALDDGGEADHLAGRGEAGDHGQQRDPGRTRQAGSGRHPEQGAERVGARVAEHRPFAKVFGKQGGRGAERGGHRESRAGPRGQQRSAGQRDLERAAGAQVEQVQQVGAAAALLPEDLGERAMLGDAGANALGALLGVAAGASLSRPARIALLAVITGLTAASEVVSFTAVIERTAALQWLDMLGRRPVPAAPVPGHDDPPPAAPREAGATAAAAPS